MKVICGCVKSFFLFRLFIDMMYAMMLHLDNLHHKPESTNTWFPGPVNIQNIPDESCDVTQL